MTGLLSLRNLIGLVIALLALIGAYAAWEWKQEQEGRAKERAEIQEQNNTANQRGKTALDAVTACDEKGGEWDATTSTCSN